MNGNHAKKYPTAPKNWVSVSDILKCIVVYGSRVALMTYCMASNNRNVPQQKSDRVEVLFIVIII